MKFACPNCKTRYSIADEKLPSSGAIKFKCKVCSTSVRLKRKPGDPATAKKETRPVEPKTQFSGESTRVAPLQELRVLQKQAADSTPGPAPESKSAPQSITEDEAATAVVSYDQLSSLRSQAQKPAKAPEGPAEWFVLLSGKQEGPFSVSKVQEKLEQKVIDKRSFVWKNGMKDWQRLGDVAIFRELAQQSGDAAWRVVKAQATAQAKTPTPQENPVETKGHKGRPAKRSEDKPTPHGKTKSAAKPAAFDDDATVATAEGTFQEAGQMFDEPTRAMSASTIQTHIKESERGDPNNPFDTSTSLMDTSELARQLEASRDVGTEFPGFADAQTDESRDDGEEEPRFAEGPQAQSVEPTEAVGAAEFSPSGSSTAATQQFEAVEEDEGFDLDFGEDEEDETVDSPTDVPTRTPSDFHKAATQLTLSADVDAAAALAGIPTGEGMSRDTSAAASRALAEADPFGADKEQDDSDSPFGGMSMDGVEGSIDGISPPDDGTPKEEGYFDAPPGEHTRVFMATAGIYQRRRRNKISAVVGTIVFLALAVIIGLDVAGIYTIPGMGIAYDLTGLEDPNAARALERATDDLDDPDLSPAEREAKRKRVAALKAKLQGQGKTKALKGRSGPKGGRGAQPVAGAEDGIGEATGSTDESKQAALDIFKDSRKKSSNVKLASANELQTPNLPAGLTQEAIFKVIQENVNSMKLCFAEAARKGEQLSGKMEVQMTIAATGSVTDAAINTAQFRQSTMGSCTVKRVKNWKFPRFNGEPVTVVFPYVLQLGF